MTQSAPTSPAGQILRAGPLSLTYRDGGLRGLTVSGREVLRRIYVAVRDADWGTVPAVLSDVQIEAAPDSFCLSYDARYHQGEIAFTQQSRITGSADGTVTFTLDGTALTSFWRNRIGFCVLHPLNGCAGQPCRVTHPNGTRVQSIFPDLIAPHQPFRQVQGIEHEILPGLRAEVLFSGDVFETEDQRNWTDASFKTYCTPLELPFPVWIEAGTRVQQSVTLRLRGSLPSYVAPTPGEPVQISFPNLPTKPLPRIGLGIAADQPPLTEQAILALRGLHLDHLRVDLALSDPDFPALLTRAGEEARAVETRLLLALHLSKNSDLELEALRRVLENSDRPIGGWLVFSENSKCTPPTLLRQARGLLKDAAPDAVWLGGTDAYFAELNRSHPALEGADGVVYSVNPQVHAFDDDSVMETPAAQAETVRSARSLYPSQALWVSPITLKPRFNPDAAGPPSDAEPEPADPRQQTPLTAAWTISSIKHLAEAGAAGLTCFETTGPSGVMSAAGELFPVYQALAEVGTYAGGEVMRTVSSHPQQVVCLALRQGTRSSVILANITAELQQVTVEGEPAGRQPLPPYAVAVLTGEPRR